jgi:P-type E1-E2 ATPase
LSDLVVGDILMLEENMEIEVDGVFISGDLVFDESSITGE